jgi:plasmid stabilization system protein ParE
MAAETPLAGRVVPEKGDQEIHEVFVRNYRIVYRVGEDAIYVLTVFEGHRLYPDDAALSRASQSPLRPSARGVRAK